MASANAFAQIMAPSASASSSKRRREQFDVFINHRGPDTKQTLAASIHHSLKLMGLRVFLDEPELDLGDSIPSEIQQAIATSFLHIAILSPRYAESTWCLEELSLMHKSGQKVIPLFYNVDVNDIRWIKGRYAEEFSKLEAKNRYRPEKIGDWKSALQTVSYLKGYIVTNEDDKEVLKSIANFLLKGSEKIPFVVAPHPVGLDKILQDFKRSVFEYSENIKIVGITGIGGCGKTTLAKQYYNEKMQSFYRCSFVFIERDEPVQKQKKMFQDLGGSKNRTFNNVEEGKAILANCLRNVKVFIILDNVDHQDQLEAFLPIKDSLIQGSVIVVTSRDPGVLISWGILSSSIYKMEDLNHEHAMELFCQHAFRQPSPSRGFECLVKDFLRVCKGLPLSIKVLGALVHNKSKEFWKNQLEKFSRSLHIDIKKILMISFDTLDKEEKEIFLDICCFFIGTEKDSAIPVLEESRLSGAGSLGTLIDKCLIEVDQRQCLRMHDLLRDLGRDISNTWSPFRLWSPQQITHIIENQGEESVQVRGIKAQTDEFYEELMELVRESGRGIKLKRGLKILDVDNNYFTEELAELSEGLVSLRLSNIPHAALPSCIPSQKLRYLELNKAPKLEELWREGADAPVLLRVLKIIDASNFQRFPRSIGFLKHLKEISFDGIRAPIEGLPDEFCCLQSLERLKLVGCHELKSLPKKFGDLTNLSHLSLIDCYKIKGLPEEFGCLQSLEYLELSGCDELKSLPRKFSDLTNLRELILDHCPEIEGLPEEFGRLQSLERLKLEGCNELKSLPNKFRDLTNLSHLSLIECEEIKCLPEEFGCLQSLEYLMLSDCDQLKSWSSNFGDLTNLKELKISCCLQLAIPSEALGQLSSLYNLDITFTFGFIEFVIHPNRICNPESSFCSLKHIKLSNCSVSRISISPDGCPSLQNLQLHEIEELKEIDSLPVSVKEVVVIDCFFLKSLSLCGLVNLENLYVQNSVCLGKIKGIGNCSSLEALVVDIEEEPEMVSLKDKERLRRVSLTAECYRSAGCHKSALEACLQTLNREKWPSECMICYEAPPGVKEMVKSFTFPDVTFVDSFGLQDMKNLWRQRTDYDVNRNYWRYVFLKERPADAAAMICLVVKSNSYSKKFLKMTCVKDSDDDTGNGSKMVWRENGQMCLVGEKKIWIGVFSASSLVGTEVSFSLDQYCHDNWYHRPDDVVEMGILAMGEENRVVDAFYGLVQHLGKAGSQSSSEAEDEESEAEDEESQSSSEAEDEEIEAEDEESLSFSLDQYCHDNWYHRPDDVVEMGILAMGEENRVVDAFYGLVQHLGKAGSQSSSEAEDEESEAEHEESQSSSEAEDEESEAEEICGLLLIMLLLLIEFLGLGFLFNQEN